MMNMSSSKMRQAMEMKRTLAAIQAGNASYNCTVVYNDQMGVFGVYVTGGTAK